MAKTNFDDSDGVWRTINGRKIFIREGQSLASAMRESGKFTKSGKNNIKEEKNISDVKKDDKQNENKETSNNNVEDLIRMGNGSYAIKRKGEKLEDTVNAYNERQKEYRKNLESEVWSNLRDPRRLKDPDLVDTYIEMNERGEFNDPDNTYAVKDKYTRNMKNMAGEPLYGPDRIAKKMAEGKIKTITEEDKQEAVNEMNTKIRQEAYRKYMQEHPNSKMSFAEFKDMYKLK